MSIVRMGEDGSEVYLYPTADGGVNCHWCSLTIDSHFTSSEALAQHLRDHQAAGHHVPVWVMGEIE